MAEPFIAEIKIISWNFPPKGWAFCNGQLLPINQNQALFSILGDHLRWRRPGDVRLPNLQAGCRSMSGTASPGEWPARLHTP